MLFSCVGVGCFVGDVVWFRTCALAPVPACGFAIYTHRCRAGFDSTSAAKSSILFASYKTGNLAGTTKKSGTIWAFGKAGRVDTICISLLRDVGPTAKKMYLPDR